MRKIVVPTDFSENAFNALRYTVELFKYETSEIYLLHAYAEEVYAEETSFNQDSLSTLKKKIEEHTTGKLNEIEGRIKEFSPNPRHQFKIRSSFALLVDGVNDLVEMEKADIVVMGTRGKSNYSNLTFGSNTLQVMKYVQCPVLCIPQNYRIHSPEKIIFPTDYLLPYQKRELKLVAEIARRFSSEIHMLYFSEFPPKALRQEINQASLKEAFNKIRLSFHTRNAATKEEAIEEAIREFTPDLLIMVNSRQTYLESILVPSTVDKVGLHPKIPFLVLQNNYRT